MKVRLVEASDPFTDKVKKEFIEVEDAEIGVVEDSDVTDNDSAGVPDRDGDVDVAGQDSVTDEEIAAELVDVDYVVKIPPVKEYTAQMVITHEKPEQFIDITMVGKVLTRSIQNTTDGVWRKCYPGAFWMKDGKRLSDPTTKGQCVGDIRPGLTVTFVVVVPKFPLGNKPDLLRIAILEDGVGWHTVEDLRVR